MTVLPHRKTREGILIKVRVQPRSSRNEVAGLQGDALKVRVTAPPVEGEANARLIELLADEFGLRRSDIEIVKGSSSRTKVVLLKGVNTLY
jgi:uncharacterized protein (TIGR00251 family)